VKRKISGKESERNTMVTHSDSRNVKGNRMAKIQKKKSNDGKKRSRSTDPSDGKDWIESLVLKETEKTEKCNTKIISTSKEQRIAKREVKKIERGRRKEEKLLFRAKKRGGTREIIGHNRNSSRKPSQNKLRPHKKKSSSIRMSKERLGRLKESIECIVLTHFPNDAVEDDADDAVEKKRRPNVRPYNPQILIGKATAGQKKKTEGVVQPKNNDYGGLGLARPSLYIPFDDISFVPKLEEEFSEHIDGFFGKTRTKAMKKQSDGNMLWRQRLKAKQAAENLEEYKNE